MTSDHPKKPKKPSDIAEQFEALLQIRKQVHQAELDLSRNRSPRAEVDPKVNARRPQNPRGRTRTR